MNSLGEEEALAEQPPALAVLGHVRRRVDQQLEAAAARPASAALIAVTAASVPPAESPPTAIRSGSAPSSLGVLGDPLERRPAVVDRGGEGVLGGQPVVDREHPGVGPLGEQPAGRVVRCRGRRRPCRRRGGRPAAARARPSRPGPSARRAAPAPVRRRRAPRGRGSRRPAGGRRRARVLPTQVARRHRRARHGRRAPGSRASRWSRSSHCVSAVEHLPVDGRPGGRRAAVPAGAAGPAARGTRGLEGRGQPGDPGRPERTRSWRANYPPVRKATHRSPGGGTMAA